MPPLKVACVVILTLFRRLATVGVVSIDMTTFPALFTDARFAER